MAFLFDPSVLFLGRKGRTEIVTTVDGSDYEPIASDDTVSSPSTSELPSIPDPSPAPVPESSPAISAVPVEDEQPTRRRRG